MQQDTGYEYFAKCYDALTQNVDYADWADKFIRLIRRFGREDTKDILDVGCGTGALTEIFAQRGYAMCGIDYSTGMLQQACLRKITAQLPMHFYRQDMRAFSLHRDFDAVISSLDSLNHLEGLDALYSTFVQVYAHLRAGGVFVFDMNTLYKHRQILGCNTFTYETEDIYCGWENTLLEDNRTVQIELQIFTRGRDNRYDRHDEWFTETAYEIPELRRALAQAGFDRAGFLDADTLHKPEETTQRLIGVAVKAVQTKKETDYA